MCLLILGSGLLVDAGISSAAVSDVRLVVYTDRYTYEPGRTVSITIRLENRGLEPVTLHYGSTCAVTFNVADTSGVFVYESRRDCFFWATEITLSPGEGKEYLFTWDQTNNAGAPVPWPNDYLIVARSLSAETIPGAVAFITIEPPGPVSLTVFTDKASYAPSERVAITARVTNAGPEAVTLNFPTSCQVFFSVEGLDGRIWYGLVRHVACLMVLSALTLQPGESKDYFFVWDQRDDSGMQVPWPADYRIVVYSQSSEYVPAASTIIRIAGSIDVRITAPWAQLYAGQAMEVSVHVRVDGAPLPRASVVMTASTSCGLSPPSGTTDDSGMFVTVVRCTAGPMVATVRADVSLSGAPAGSATVVLYILESPLPLSISVTSRTTRMMSRETATIRVRLTSDGFGVPGALVATTSLPAGAFSPVTDLGGGDYVFQWTAPNVTATTNAAIRVGAKVGGYSESSRGTYVITVDPNRTYGPPPPIFSVALAESISLRSGESILVRLYLFTLEGYPVTGAVVVLAVFGGGTVTPVRDERNGLYTFLYTAPLVTGDATMLLRISFSKAGYQTGVRSLGLTVSP